MDIPINKKLIDELKQSKGFLEVSITDLQTIHKLLSDKRAKVIVINRESFVVMAELINIQFQVRGVFKREAFNFIDTDGLSYVNADDNKFGFSRFILDEFFQGAGWQEKLKRSLVTISPLVLLNIVAYYFAAEGSIKDVIAGLLTAISIFVAIFSLFTTSHDYLLRKRLSLFEKGKLGYYFSIDSHITKTGVYTILLSILMLIASSSLVAEESGSLYNLHTQNVIVIIGLNLCFLGVYITLRSIVEFYIKRPARFILGDLKQESIDSYRRDIDKL